MIFSGNKTAVVIFVNDIIQNLKENSALTMTITRKKLEDCSVHFVIDELSDDTEMQLYSKELTNIYQQEQDG